MRVLLLEDDTRLAAQVARMLENAGHSVVHRREGMSLSQSTLDSDFDVGIFDIGLPGIDGLDILKMLRAGGVKLPVLFLTARGAVRDRVEGLRGGADDYLVKPFSFEELEVRLEVLCRRKPPGHETGCFDYIKRTFREGGLVVELQPKELAVLSVLAEHPGAVVGKSFLLEQVWGLQFDPGTNVVDAMICRIRSKLANAGMRCEVRTVKGKGYAFQPAD
ncbi:MAG: two-component system response regulator UczR [Terrimicrobiaceae bacterium]